jgi:SNF2 family DNA or RNA helicase
MIWGGLPQIYIFIVDIILIWSHRLGKTIQTLVRVVDGRPKKSDKQDGWAAGTLYVYLTFFSRYFYMLTVSPCRVVCPVALVSQWASEIQKMCVGLRVIEHHGASRTTGQFSLSHTYTCVLHKLII